MDFRLTEEQIILRDSTRRMMDRHATPDYIRRLDREDAYPEDLYAQWVEMGLLRLPFAEEFGGLSGDGIDLILVAEELAAKSYDFFSAFGASIFCGLNVVRHGTDEQKQLWIPPLLAGKIKMSISMSEPDAGSDVGAMRCSAVRDGSDWIINGQKVWASGAGARNNVINLYVRTDPNAPHRSALSLFLVPNDLPGITLRKLDMLGRRCVGTYEIFFDNVRVPADNLIGQAGHGWQCMLSGLQIERVTAAAGYCGGARSAFELALDYAKERKQFGRAIGTNQVIAHMLADLQAEIEVARTMVWRAGWAMGQGDPDALRLITIAKLVASETYVKAANCGMQVFGGAGYNMEYDMQRHFRDSRSCTIAAGTSQMQRNLLSGLMGLKVH
ncbi:acyl-CoA/acyl-ACP dehydrogenase [Roseiarcaceae bacterium H3SJ34-1]|uniref:acyl-CoA dehydrogenase family protein n=1 Tax=Terripilifer ovatus TaxID=3032367 RepID=UPI003AB96ADB|nr:acyl-CoA/acyl-ACP dehydrogenase [Roseiarcaceae bacterium H3SJ34-1]